MITCEAYGHFGIPLPSRLRAYYVDQVVFEQIYPEAQKKYLPRRYSGRVVYFESEETRGRSDGWQLLMTNGLEVRRVSGDHLSMLSDPNLRGMAEQLNTVLTDAQKDAMLCASARKGMPQDGLEQRFDAI